MLIPKHDKTLRRMLESRLKKLGATSPILAATLSSYSYRCGRSSCRCAGEGPLHTGQHLTFKENGKTRSVCVPKDMVTEVRSWIARHRQLKDLLHEIHLLSLALVRQHAQTRRRKAGRP